jgi:predicted ArsR family transcriptional regulator
VTEHQLDAIAGLADALRRSLYRYVVERAEPVGKDEVAAHGGISRSLASYHLDRLAADGLLSVTYARLSERRGPGAGRPAKLYAVAPTEINVQLPPRDDALLARLLAAAVEADDSGATRSALVRVARAEGEQVGAEHRRAATVPIGALLADRGYAPIESDAGIRMRNCPFHHLVAEHRDLVCGLNLALLDAAVQAAECPYTAELDPSPGHCCVVLRPTTATDESERAQ